MRADEIEVLAELAEVLLQRGAVPHDLLSPLLDLHALEAEHDHLQVGGERRRGDGEHALPVRVREQGAGLAGDELVVDRLRREVHEREVERAALGPDVLRRDRVDVALHVAGERLLVELALGLVAGCGHALEVVERELRVHGQQQACRADDGVHALSAWERVLDLVRVGREPVAKQVLEEQLAEAAAGLRRPQRLLEPGEVLGALVHLRRRLRHLAEALVDLRRGLVAAGEAPVDGLGDVGEPAVDVGVALVELARRVVAERRELGRDEPREHEGGRQDGEHDEDEESDDHWADER